MGAFVNELRKNREKELRKIRKEGRKEGRIETAENMLKEKFDINVIERLTGLKRNQFM